MTASASKMSCREDPRLEAAQRRLRESVGQEDTLEAVREIVTNLLGCEEVGLFKVEKEGGGLLWSFGVDTERHGTLDSFDKSAVHRAMQGECHVVQAPDAGKGSSGTSPLRVFVPMRLHGRTLAVLVMLTLLPQKVGFSEDDLNLVKLLSDEAARALFERSANANA